MVLNWILITGETTLNMFSLSSSKPIIYSSLRPFMFGYFTKNVHKVTYSFCAIIFCFFVKGMTAISFFEIFISLQPIRSFCKLVNVPKSTIPLLSSFSRRSVRRDVPRHLLYFLVVPVPFRLNILIDSRGDP